MRKAWPYDLVAALVLANILYPWEVVGNDERIAVPPFVLVDALKRIPGQLVVTPGLWKICLLGDLIRPDIALSQYWF